MKLLVFGNELAMKNEGGRGVKDDSYISGLYNHVLHEAHH